MACAHRSFIDAMLWYVRVLLSHVYAHFHRYLSFSLSLGSATWWIVQAVESTATCMATPVV
eukprot:m.87640 g.87640  ORF g.87640 m.87640 type:complete len:61 (-) comp9713_c0_seq1:1395-1577(-)